MNVDMILPNLDESNAKREGGWRLEGWQFFISLDLVGMSFVKFQKPKLLVFRPLKTQLDKPMNLAKLLLSQIN